MRIKSLFPNRLSLMMVVVFFLAACDSGAPLVEDKGEPPVRPAKLIKVDSTNSKAFLNYPAVIQSQQLSVLSFEVSGKLKALSVVEAQQVKKGEVLARLDQRDLQAKLTSARAEFKNAEEEYQRAQRLIEQDAISKSKVEVRKSKLDVSKAKLETAQKALQDSVLVAPFDGAIAKVSIKKRQIIQPGKPAITVLGNAGLEAVINIPSSIIVQAGKQEKLPTDSYVVLSAAPDRRIPATFREAALEADAATQTYEITFIFDAPKDLVILPGMNASVWIRDLRQSAAGTNEITIPLTAIVTEGEQKYVWVVDDQDMTVSKRVIVVESDVGSNLSVSGLDSGETIVSSGVSSLSVGMKVRPWSKNQ